MRVSVIEVQPAEISGWQVSNLQTFLRVLPCFALQEPAPTDPCLSQIKILGRLFDDSAWRTSAYRRLGDDL